MGSSYFSADTVCGHSGHPQAHMQPLGSPFALQYYLQVKRNLLTSLPHPETGRQQQQVNEKSFYTIKTSFFRAPSYIIKVTMYINHCLRSAGGTLTPRAPEYNELKDTDIKMHHVKFYGINQDFFPPILKNKNKKKNSYAQQRTGEGKVRFMNPTEGAQLTDARFPNAN